MKENRSSLVYTLDGTITLKDEEHGTIETLKGKNVDSIDLTEFTEDVLKWFRNRDEGDVIKLSFEAKIVE